MNLSRDSRPSSCFLKMGKSRGLLVDSKWNILAARTGASLYCAARVYPSPSHEAGYPFFWQLPYRNCFTGLFITSELSYKLEYSKGTAECDYSSFSFMEYRIRLLDFFHPPLYLLLLPLPVFQLSPSPESPLALRQIGFLGSSHPRLIIKLSRQQQHGMSTPSSRPILIHASPFIFHLRSPTTPSHALLTSAATKISTRATRQVLY